MSLGEQKLIITKIFILYANKEYKKIKSFWSLSLMWIKFNSTFSLLKDAFSIYEQFQKWKQHKNLTSIQLLRQGYCHDEQLHWSHSMSAFPKHFWDYYILFDL